MISLLEKIFINKYIPSSQRRSALGVLCGGVGILLNIILFVCKLFAGILSNSVSITADALNNLSDAGSSIITLIGFRLSSQKPDKEHPYGHGRIEYLSAFIVSAAIIAMGFELMKSSIHKLINPVDIDYSLTIIIILIISILVKLYMVFYNFSIGKKIDSTTLRATGRDSLSDCFATTAVLISTLISHYFKINLDGYCGILVSLFILYSGYSSLREAIDPLLGMPPEPEYIEKIKKTVIDFDENIVGVHDLMIHDYGPSRKFISLHAEVPSDGNILILHDIIDNLEKKLSSDLGCVTTIHMDPVDINNPVVNKLKARVAQIVLSLHPDITIHDFRVVNGNSHTNLIFDVVIPFSYEETDDIIIQKIDKLVKESLGNQFFTVVDIDRATF